MHTVSIAGLGRHFPDNVLNSNTIEERLGLEPGWIHERTGISQRRVAGPDETPSTMATAAARAALSDAGLAPEDLDGIIVATTVPDTFCPSTACRAQAALGATRAWAFDLNAASAGFVYALAAGAAFIASGAAGTILIAAAETATRFIDPDDRGTAVLFGDAAGAVVLRKGDARPVLAAHLAADGALGGALVIPGGGAAMPPSAEVAEQKLATLKMKGGDVFRYAAGALGDTAAAALKKCGLTFGDVDLVVPHQSNRRIIAEAARRMGLPESKFFMNIESVGNTSVASVPVALSEASEKGLLKKDSVIVLVSYGAGLASAAAVVRW